MATKNIRVGNVVRDRQDVECKHHWCISRPEGPTSIGNCKNCGSEREFLNYFEGSTWGSDISLDQIGKGDKYPSNTGLGAAVEAIKAEEAS